jgi:cytochrome c oxidase assembly protein subunit 15
MFLFPPRLWIGGILYEHTHRLMATVVGFCSILLMLAAWIWDTRPWARWLATSVLGAVIFQGVLGGLRVVLVKLDLAIVHACVAQAFFCLAALAAIVTSRWWLEAPDLSKSEDSARGRKLITLCIACVITIYLQLIVGAMMRHFDAGLAIPDLPLAYGKLLPPTSTQELANINTRRVFEMNLKPVTLTQIWLHFGHRIGACLVTLMIVLVTATIFRKHRRQTAFTRPAMVLLILLLLQLTLGVLTVVFRKPADIASAHVATGAAVLVTTFVLTVRAMRLYSPSFRSAPEARNAENRGFEVGKAAVA